MIDGGGRRRRPSKAELVRNLPHTSRARRENADHQHEVDRHFGKAAWHWKDLYGEESLEGVIHQDRRSRTLELILKLGLPRQAQVLEVGCGAGLLAIALAGRGYRVSAIDTSEAMVDLAQSQADEADVPGSLSVQIGDAHSLNFGSCVFDLVIALGVVPFLHSPRDAIAEMARVVRPGGWVLFSSDNAFRLTRLLDPRYIPFPGREALKRRLIRAGVKAPPGFAGTFFSSKAITGIVDDAGLKVVRCETLGFGPFTFLGRDLFHEAAAIRLNRLLQGSADRRVRGVRALGAQHLILAQKPT
jgi:2-polyprenyl-3-methyl-5-hydroxy-6-metoxy-1,4-benzoquinol methylase